MYLQDLVQGITFQHLSTIIGTYLFYRLGLVIYRLTLHPLARIPGYKLAVATRLYEFHYDSTMHGRYWTKIQEMHNKLGPIVRINPNEVHINDPEFYHKLYNFDPAWSKSPAMVALSMHRNIEMTLESGLHKKRRAPFEEFFSRKEITAVEERIRKFSDKLCDAIREAGKKREAIRFHLLARAFTAEIICEYCFGREYGFFEDLSAAQEFLLDISRPGDLSYVHHIGRYSPLLQKAISTVQGLAFLLKKQIGLKTNGGFKVFFKYADDLVVGAMANKAEPKKTGTTSSRTIFHEILESELPPSEKDHATLFENAVLFLFAGFETTGFSLTLGVASILSDQTIHDRLKSEIRSVWPDVHNNPTTPSWSELERLPFLHACILESLRLSCGVLSRLPRVTDHSVVFENYVIPAGTSISMSQPLIHYNASIFPEPMAFKPDRWLDGTPAERRKLERYLVPFSGGSRGCIGKLLAMAELHIVLATVIRRFEDMRLVEPTNTEDLMPFYDEFTPVTRTGKQKLMVEVH